MPDTATSSDIRTTVNTLNWGVVGFGWVARDYAVPGMLAASGRLVAVADPDPAACRAAAAMGARPRDDRGAVG